MSPDERERLARLEGVIGQLENMVRTFAPVATQVLEAGHDAEEARRENAEQDRRAGEMEKRLGERIDRSHDSLKNMIADVAKSCKEIRDHWREDSRARIGARGTVIAALLTVAGVVIGKLL